MALYHFSVKQVSRGKGQTVVNSAAYISGQKLYNDYYGQTHDYTKKSGVVFTEILTPEYAPERLSDRETLWNEVEQIEKSKRAQLAYSFDIALQNELTLDENIELAREFCWEQFVARGMIVDLAVHEGKSKNEDEPDNPHFHVLAPIRPFTEEGSWGGTALSEGIGEKLSRVDAMPGCYILIAKPGISVSTAFVYQNLNLSGLAKHPDIDGMLECLRTKDLKGICDRLENVLETVTIKEYPIIEEVKKHLVDQGAMGALMSGSGPTIFAIFQDKKTADNALKSLRSIEDIKQAYVVRPIR